MNRRVEITDEGRAVFFDHRNVGIIRTFASPEEAWNGARAFFSNGYSSLLRHGDMADYLLDDEESHVPYPEFCRHRDVCEGKRHCPLNPTCAD